MPRYPVVIYWSDIDDAFIAIAPDLPGCAADGFDYEEAARNIAAAITTWVETAALDGRELPPPTAGEVTIKPGSPHEGPMDPL